MRSQGVITADFVMKKILFPLLLLAGLGLSAQLLGGADHDHDQDEHHDHPEDSGRITIAADLAKASGLTTAIATGGLLHQRIKLYGNLVPDPQRLVHIQARYPGLIRQVNPSIGSQVKTGDLLARIESNESLREYSLMAPVSGQLIERHANPGEQAGEQVLFSILDDSMLELHLQVFPGDASKIKPGQNIQFHANGQQAHTQVDYITPRLGETPTLEVHAPVNNSGRHWVLNQAVEAWMEVAQTPVELMVDNRALQSFRDWQVVFIQIGDTYEIRPLELGRSDGQFTEVLSGLRAGDRYVVESSFLLKADLEKSGAAHDH